MPNVRSTHLYSCIHSLIFSAYRKLDKEYHPDKSPNAGDKFKEIMVEVVAWVFSLIFGGGLFGFMVNQSRSRNGRRRGGDMMHPLKVFLEDLCNGKTTRLHLSKNALCAIQKGSAGLGRGVHIMIKQLAPGMVQQMQSVINEKDYCKKCEGKKMTKEVKILEVHIDKGLKHGQRIYIYWGSRAGPRKHEVFQRDGNDFHMTYKIGLVKALCGFQFTFKHLDGHQIVLSELEDFLSSRPEVLSIIGDREKVELQEFDSTQDSGGGQRPDAYNDSSDEESSSHHGPGVQCAHQ
ncbi:hypothetical protein JEQ12_002884 [Ovis aries]|uniref:Chaperone DnaJ C-terminal domain-containing protein n=1 Tax=Ovis aries TaxID=9940 RepID=A0A836A8G9_SHEEP|nr:hypothetical protein JEQ12_002884 [Ovis aries]